MTEKITAESIRSELASMFEYLRLAMGLAEKQISVTGDVKEMMKLKVKEAGGFIVENKE